MRKIINLAIKSSCHSFKALVAWFLLLNLHGGMRMKKRSINFKARQTSRKIVGYGSGVGLG